MVLQNPETILYADGSQSSTPMATPMAIRKPTYVDQQQSSELGQSLESEHNKSTLHGDEKRSLLSKESEKNFE